MTPSQFDHFDILSTFVMIYWMRMILFEQGHVWHEGLLPVPGRVGREATWGHSAFPQPSYPPLGRRVLHAQKIHPFRLCRDRPQALLRWEPGGHRKRSSGPGLITDVAKIFPLLLFMAILIIGIIGSEGTYDWKIHPEWWIFQSLVTEEPMNRNYIY